ncbi:uncharacterized protein M421DRAFT_347309 [Didymella exigua CBS 183.55]|uniref:F-box domain-containing protein n=1 Tax=Didymella exigua CBS 183.55 TaxID=1150837 RepID=A0A6A5RUB1_9PLEO|nr:uncharacterized protein M421DRAFT_347309 [Didymella exigua CBS 183.55]KAF1931432.1 hypothetical protein M421DRAFT_347309 [Didymella exigua CBS 183.55]
MSSTWEFSNVPFLPPEIYLAIARHIQVTDLPSFCLANKTLAAAGRPELFHTVVLRSTVASWAAFKRVKKHEKLCRLVQTMVLDVTSWRTGKNVRDWHEWTRYCQSQANHYTQVDVDSAQAALYKELAESRHLWEAYLSRLEEEKAVVEEIAVGDIRLPKLRKCYVVRGAYRLKDHPMSRLYGQGKLPITSPLSAWRGDSFSQAPNGQMLAPLRRLLPSAAPDVIKWRLGGLSALELSLFSPKNHVKNPDVSSFRIWFGMSDCVRTPHGIPPRYFDQWPNLESLTLDLGNRTPAARYNTAATLQTIQHIFGVGGRSAAATNALESAFRWPRLRKLSLGHFDSTPEALTSLIARHGSTLRDLRLHAVWLRHEHPGNNEVSIASSWQDVFRSIGVSTNLDRLKLSGLFCNDSIQEDDWNFDVVELGSHIATWIMKGEQRSQREGLLLKLRSHYMSHDLVSDSTELTGPNGAVTSGAG